MQLPIDVGALINEMTDIDAARETPLSVSVYVDEAASTDVAAHVRAALASTSPTVRMTVSYLDSSFVPHPVDDFAIVVAGDSAVNGAAAAALRAVGVPVMIVTTMPATVEAIAAENGHAIPDGDLVAPVNHTTPDYVAADEPVPFDDGAATALDDRMGKWVVAACREKRLAFAIAFPFMRKALARDAVFATSLQNAGIGLVPFIPGADLPLMTLNQAKMVLQISAAYGREMGTSRIKEIAAVVGAGLLGRTIARELVEFVPILGWIIKPGVAYGTTAAMGYAVIEYFEGGENLVGVANVAEKVAGKGAKVMDVVREKAPQIAALLPERSAE